MVNSNNVKTLMLKYFPKCPICFQSKGFDVLGADNDYVSCKKCDATWQSDDFLQCQELKRLKLTQPSKQGIGRFLLGKTFSVDFWLDWRNAIRAQQDAMMQKEIVLSVDEEIKERIPSKYQRSRTVYEGFLFLTNRRVVFISQEDFFVFNFRVGILYEDIVSSKSNLSAGCLEILDQRGDRFLFQVPLEEHRSLIGKICKLADDYKRRVELEKSGNRIQIVIDFSSLKSLVEKGMILQVLKCPHCGGRIDALPSSGDVFECAYCKNKIFAIDVFHEISRLINSADELS